MSMCLQLLWLGTLVQRAAAGATPVAAVDVKVAPGIQEQLIALIKEHYRVLPYLPLVFIVLYTLYRRYTAIDPTRGKEQLSLEVAAAAKENTSVFLDITINGQPQGRVELLLFTRFYPKTAENFRCLCTGEKGLGQSGKELTFKHSKFHRIMCGLVCQGGDFTHGNGSGGESIYGGKFEDEWDHGYIAFDRPNLLAMANRRPNSNGSQFFLSAAARPHLSGKHVVFGMLAAGEATLKAMVNRAGSQTGVPTVPVQIVDCGEVKSKSQ